MNAAFPLKRPKDIHLLDIDGIGSAATPNAPIFERLRVVSLEDCPEYTSLSYVWGERTVPPDTIICGQRAMPVTSSLYSALRELRRQEGSLYIWVDAICINQDDDEEKSAQVQLIGEIYSWAQVVYV